MTDKLKLWLDRIDAEPTDTDDELIDLLYESRILVEVAS